MKGGEEISASQLQLILYNILCPEGEMWAYDNFEKEAGAEIFGGAGSFVTREDGVGTKGMKQIFCCIPFIIIPFSPLQH